jgi:hypothetical protein
MLLQKVRGNFGDIMVTPVFDKHNAMFMHCANGHIRFPNKLFKKDLLPVLVGHGFLNVRVKALKK